MNKKFTLLIIPDDEASTKSYTLSKNLLKFVLVVTAIILIVLIFILIQSIPSISKYGELKNKYDELAQERLKVIELSQSISRIKQMDKFVRNSLGLELNFKEIPEIMDSILMVIPNQNDFISFTDNIPSIAPIEGYISQRMGSQFSLTENKHGGIDIVAKEGTPIKASASGLVVFSGWTYEMGNLIIIHHGDGYFTHYGHNQQNLKYQLDVVKRGEVIGLVGNTGISSGPHLHFEIWKDQQSIDPLEYFPEYNQTDLTSSNG